MERKYSILIVDDEAEHSANIKDILELNGYAVNTAINGKDALSFCQKDSYDLALVDIKLPDISGNMVVSEMAKISPSTEYIYITGYASIDTAIEAAKQEHVVSYETKPINMDSLLPIIKQITERKQAEEEMRKTTDLLKNVINSTPDLIFVKDLKLRTIMCNEAYANAVGKKPEGMIGNTDIENGWNPELVRGNPEKRIRGFENDDRQALSGKEVHNPHDPANVGNKILIFDTRKLPLYDVNGQIMGVLGVARDITERKRIEEVLQFTQFAVDNNADATYWVKSDAKISYVNKAACHSLGYSYEELTCMRVPDINSDFPYESWPAHWQEMKEAGTLTFEAHHKTKAGLVFPVEIQSTYLEYDGQEYICAFVRNITERKKIEEILLQSEKLRAMGIMTSGVAHDFNNILAVISGNAQLMERNYGDHKEMMDGFHIIRKAVSDGAEIVRRMRKFTKVERDTSEFISVDIKEILEQAIEFSRPRWMNMAKARGITYDIDKAGIKEVQTILGSPSELREVFVNIINNAMDAMTGGGCITFCTWHRSGESRGSSHQSLLGRGESRGSSARRSLLGRGESPPQGGASPKRGPTRYSGGSSHQSLLGRGTLSKDDTVFVSISDTGEGMTEEVRKRIFDPFFTTKRAEGSGLGMSVAYGVITGHGGKIEVESEVGKGATFTMSIPITRETSQQAVSPEPHRKIKGDKLRILVVDDEEKICSMLNKYFSRDGHDVKSVNNGIEAIKLLKNEEFDLVLCDLVLPDISGHDIVKVIGELDKRPRVGLITGWDEKIETRGKEELKVDFISRKPFDFSKLTSHINEVLGAG